MQVSCKASAHLIATHTGRDAQKRSSIIQGDVWGAIHKTMHVLWLSRSDHSCDKTGLLALALAIRILIWYFLTHHLQYALNGQLTGSFCCIFLASASRHLVDSGFLIHETWALTLVHFWTWQKINRFHAIQVESDNQVQLNDCRYVPSPNANGAFAEGFVLALPLLH